MNSLSKFLIKHLGLFFIIYTAILLVVQFGGLKNNFSKLFRKNATSLFSTFGSGGEVQFKKDKNKDNVYDVLAVLSSKQQKQNARKEGLKKGLKQINIKTVKFPINSWNFAGMLIVFYLVLIVVTPMKWVQKILPFILGMLFVYLFTNFKIWVSLLLRFSEYHERFQVGLEYGILSKIVNYAYNIISFPFFGLVMVLLIWFLTCFNKIKLPEDTIELAYDS